MLYFPLRNNEGDTTMRNLLRIHPSFHAFGLSSSFCNWVVTRQATRFQFLQLPVKFVRALDQFHEGLEPDVANHSTREDLTWTCKLSEKPNSPTSVPCPSRCSFYPFNYSSPRWQWVWKSTIWGILLSVEMWKFLSHLLFCALVYA